jgi:predicted PhzF superfamily epimerase YddE/YHI9
MTAIPYWHVDAFAQRPFAGNQAAVMRLDHWLDDAALQAIAAENMFAETAFVVPGAHDSDADWELRWFGPAAEVRLCGHATLAAGHVLLALSPGSDRVRLRTRKAGVLEVQRLGQGYELALPAIPTERRPFPEAEAALGLPAREVWRSADGYAVFLYGAAAEVRALRPDFGALKALGNEQFIVTAPGAETDIVSRVFVPAAGVDEDSVTGSAHAVLTPFWAERLGRDHFTAFQASVRGGRLSCRLEGDRAWLGGACVTVVEGAFFL